MRHSRAAAVGHGHARTPSTLHTLAHTQQHIDAPAADTHARQRAGTHARTTQQAHFQTAHNTTRHDTTRHDTTRHDTTRHDTTRHDTTRHDTTRHDTTRHDTTRHDTTRHDTTRHDTTRHDRCRRTLLATAGPAVLGAPSPHGARQPAQLRGCPGAARLPCATRGSCRPQHGGMASARSGLPRATPHRRQVEQRGCACRQGKHSCNHASLWQASISLRMCAMCCKAGGCHSAVVVALLHRSIGHDRSGGKHHVTLAHHSRSTVLHACMRVCAAEASRVPTCWLTELLWSWLHLLHSLSPQSAATRVQRTCQPHSHRSCIKHCCPRHAAAHTHTHTLGSCRTAA
jgi:hypothetical protein